MQLVLSGCFVHLDCPPVLLCLPDAVKHYLDLGRYYFSLSLGLLQGNRRQGILDLGFAEGLSGVRGDNKSEGVTVGSSKQMFSGHFLYLLGVRFLDPEGTNLISGPRICSSYGQLKCCWCRRGDSNSHRGSPTRP